MKDLRSCSMCGCTPCESPVWCRGQAAREAEAPDPVWESDEVDFIDPDDEEVDDAN